jgi:hypothetical protein
MARRQLAVVFAALLCGAAPLAAQSAVEARAGVSRPAISPGRAFLSSLLVPGTGQSALDRPYAGGVFVLVEVLSLTMMHRAAEDLSLARRFSRDSLPLAYQTDPVTGIVALDSLGNPVVSSWQSSKYSRGIVRARRLHLEDWVAVLFFNHLFSGADAYVAAHLWDLPEKVSVMRTPDGRTVVGATLRFGRPPRR